MRPATPTWTNVEDLIQPETSPLAYTLKGLVNGQPYDLQVRAVTEANHRPMVNQGQRHLIRQTHLRPERPHNRRNS